MAKKNNEMSSKDIAESLKDNKDFLIREYNRNVPPAEQRQAVGRIGELFVAHKENAKMAAYTNQKGFDVYKEDESGKIIEQISVKTTTRLKGSHQFKFSKSTLSKVDRIILLYLHVSDGEVTLHELLDVDVAEGEKYWEKRVTCSISLSRTKHEEVKEALKELKDNEIEEEIVYNVGVMFEIDVDVYNLMQEKDKSVAVSIYKNGNRIESDKRGTLKELASQLGIENTRSNGDPFTNQQYFNKIKKKIKEDKN